MKEGAQVSGVRLWPGLNTLYSATYSPIEDPPNAIKQAFGTTARNRSGIEPCSQFQDMIIDDTGFLSLCVQIYGRNELLPTGLSTDEFSPDVITQMSKDPAFAVWSSDDHSRTFVLNASRINDYLNSQQLWSPDQSQLSLLTK